MDGHSVRSVLEGVTLGHVLDEHRHWLNDMEIIRKLLGIIRIVVFIGGLLYMVRISRCFRNF